MKGPLLVLLSFAFLAAGPFVRAQTDEEVEAHKQVLDLTGAFSNEGFKLRDGHWAGLVKPSERTLIAVNLYAGNQYWFSAAANAKAKKIAVELYDESGKPMVTETYNSEGKASAGFSPVSSGQYFVSLGLVEGEAATFCLVYSYK